MKKVLLFLPLLVFANSLTTSEQSGYFWYKEEKKEKKEKKEERKTLEQLQSMDVDELREYHDKVLKQTMNNSTKDNILHYLEVKKVLYDKAEAFARAVSFYSTQTQETSAIYLSSYREAQYEKEKAFNREIIQKNKQDFALLYFKSEQCPYCKAQKPILDTFIATYQFTIKEIDREKEPHLFKTFNITATPTIMLIYKKSKTPFTISIGIIPLNELEKRVVFGIRYLKGEVKESEF